MSPNNPKTELKISITSTLTNLKIKVSSYFLRNLDGIKLRLQAWIRSVGQCCAAPVDPHGNATYQVAHAHRQTGPEKGVPRVLVRGRVGGFPLDHLQFGGEDDGHDDAVYRHHFAEDDGYQVLGPYSRCFDTAAEDRGAGDEDTPG